MADEKSMAERMAEIEAMLAFSEDALDELNRTVYRQQQAIERLQQQLRALQEIVEGAAGEPPAATDETPPHY